MPLRVFNSFTKRAEEFTPRDPSRVTFYTCGPTVYDDAHIGNFRSFLAADVLRRWVESPLCELANETAEQRASREKGGRTVVHVMNITDVGHMTDDAEGGESGEDRMAVAGKRLAEAKKSGKLPPGVADTLNPNDPYQIAKFYTHRFVEDAKRLGLKLATDAEKNPGLMPRATENIAGMQAVIARLIARGNAYVVGSPGSRVVYFDVQSFPTYGTLSGNTLDKLREGAGGRIAGEHQSQKKHPADFLLWKEDASHIMKWESPWGAGYPGWHIECSVMSLEGTEARGHGGTKVGLDLGSYSVPDGEALIDIHSGGEDNIFPHHECEIAQSCCAFNAEPSRGTFAKLWFHPRFLLVEGTKMSKSKGNFFTARDLFAKGIEPAALRLELIKTHYRSNANFTMQGLDDSKRRLERWRRYAKRVARLNGKEMLSFEKLANRWPPARASRLERAERDVIEALNDDMNVAKLIAAIDSLMEGMDEVEEAIKGAMAELGLPHETRSEVTLPDAPFASSEALRVMSLGKANQTYAWEYGLLHLVDNILGVIFAPELKAEQTSLGLFMDGLSPDPAVVAKLEERRAARAAKDFKKSDQIRDELLGMGYAIKDVAGGKVEVRRK